MRLVMAFRWAVLTACVVLAMGCAPGKPDPRGVIQRVVDGGAFPDRLDRWGMLTRQGTFMGPSDRARVYELATPLYSDYAFKLRTVRVPPGARAQLPGAGDETIEFPVGTVLTKTFYYPVNGAGRVRLENAPHVLDPHRVLDLDAVRLIETRVMVRAAEGWRAVAYRWDRPERAARLTRSGALVELVAADGRSFDYLIPDANQCAGCHATDLEDRGLEPIGPKPANLEGAAQWVGADSQLDGWRADDILAAPAEYAPWPAWDVPASGTLAARTRTYLDVNCGHCHSDTGAADTAGLDLRRRASRAATGLCKPPVAAGRGSGSLAYDIRPGDPERSILLHRMQSSDPGVMMPELGRSLVHSAGTALVRQWIRTLPGDCRGDAPRADLAARVRDHGYRRGAIHHSARGRGRQAEWAGAGEARREQRPTTVGATRGRAGW